MPGNDTENRIAAADWHAWLAQCAEIGVSISQEATADLDRLYRLLLVANQHTNLTRLTAPEDFLNRHLLDSLTISPWVPPQSRVVDVGSGAGFPALPLAWHRPDVQVTAVDSVGKKCDFIRSAAESLNLTNLQVLHARSELMGQDKTWREQADCVTARAVAPLNVLLELCLPLLKPDGVFLAMKGVSFDAELAAAQRAIRFLGAELQQIVTFEPAVLQGSRLLVFKKQAPTPAQYPRSPGTPAKKPL